jgi:hypothetical protein
VNVDLSDIYGKRIDAGPGNKLQGSVNVFAAAGAAFPYRFASGTRQGGAFPFHRSTTAMGFPD